MLETFLTDFWGQIVGFIVLVAWLNRQQALHENRLHQLEKKVEQLFILHNKQIDRMLDKKDK